MFRETKDGVLEKELRSFFKTSRAPQPSVGFEIGTMAIIRALGVRQDETYFLKNVFTKLCVASCAAAAVLFCLLLLGQNFDPSNVYAYLSLESTYNSLYGLM